MSFLRVVDRFRTLAERFMVTDVTIVHRLPFAKDDSNPFGDDTENFATTTVTVKGWATAKPTEGASVPDAGSLVWLNLAHVRVPVGTVVEPGDTVSFKGQDFVCENTTAESDYAVWLDVWLRDVQ